MATTPILFTPSAKPGNINPDDAAVEYNGFKFPPALRATASFEPVMDDSGRSAKYLRFNFHISFYLFHGLNLGATATYNGLDDSNPTQGLYSGSYVRANNKPTSVSDYVMTTDEEMNFLRRRLTEPGQNFYFSSQGIGKIIVQDPEISDSVDLDNGPKPKLVTWRPLSNKCCFIEWEVSTCIAPCYGLDGIIPSAIVQFPYEVNFSINRNGTTTRKITGRLEFTNSRVPSTSEPHAGGTHEFEFSEYRNFVISVFPMLDRFWRELDFTLSDDRKYVSFVITDTEVNGDEAFGEGCVNEDVTLSTSNKNRMVFTIYDVNLSGSIELAAGYPKSYALAEISRLFHRFYTVCGGRGSQLVRQGVDPVVDKLGGSSPSGTNTSLTKVEDASRRILEYVSFTDHLFSRTVTFSIRWTLFTTLETLFKATGMFKPIRQLVSGNQDVEGSHVALEAAAWTKWKASLGTFLDSGGYSRLNINQDDDVVISFCNPPSLLGGAPQDQIEPITEEPEGYNEDSEGPDKEQGSHSAADSYGTFDARFSLEIDENAVLHAPLGDYVSLSDEAQSPNDRKANVTYTPPAIPYLTDPLQDHYVHNRREPTYLLHFSGYATRLNYPVPVPKVETVYGQPVRRVGVSHIEPRHLGVGTDLTTGESYTKHGLIWHITYALPGPPSTDTIKTDAFKEIYGVS